MIKNEELRLRNYILADGKISYVSTIFPCFIQVNDNSRMEYSLSDEDEIIPIPLTEAVLMSAGFEKDEYGFITLEDGRFYMSFDMQDGNHSMVFRTDIGLDCLSVSNTTTVDHLHKLQNLIFALTGKELEINIEELKKAVNE